MKPLRDAAARAAARAAGHRWLPVAAAATAAAGLSLLIRLLGASGAFDIFGDEVIYARLGQSAAAGGLPAIQGRPFFLHPPGFFYLEAGWQQLFGYRADPVGAVVEMRYLNALLSAFTAVVIVVLTARAAGSTRAGAAAGLLFALDPFCVRQNDRVLLETAMMLWVLLGYLTLAAAMGRATSRGTAAAAVGAGALFGLAVLTKDEAALITVLPLLVAAAAGWGPPRRLSLVAAGVTAAAYGVYLSVVAALGHIGQVWTAKTTGAGRLLGLIQATGFHRPGAPPLAARLTSEFGEFWPTYAILLLGLLAAVLLLRRGGPLPRMLGLLQASALVTLAYALSLGTLEEQELYLLIVPSLVTVPVAATLWLRRAAGRAADAPGAGAARRRGRWDPRGNWRAGAGAVAAVLLLSFDLVTIIGWLSVSDDGYARLRRYLISHVPAGAAITAVGGTTERGTAEWVLEDRYRVGRWVSPATRSRLGVRYVVVPWTEVKQGYSYLRPDQVRSLVEGGRVVFSFHGRTYGELDLYQVPLPRGAGHAP